MFRSSLVSLAIVLLLPAYAQAWYVNAKISPATGQGTITPAGNVAVQGTTGSGATFSVAPAAGCKVNRVTVDGVQAGTVAGDYTVNYVTGKSWRYIVAYFTAETVSITTSTGANGSIREANGLSLTDIPSGSTRTLIIVPVAGYTIADYSAPNATSNILHPDGTRTVTYANLQASQAVSATFSMIPVVTADAGPDVIAPGNGPSYTALLDGTLSSSNQGVIGYAWSGPAELLFATPNAPQTAVYSNTAGTYTATLTITSNGIESADSAQVTVPARAAFLEGFCTSCHATRDPVIVADYDQSKHKTTGPENTVVCQTCHDPTDSKHYTVDRPTSVCQPCHALIPTSTHATEDLADRCLECHNSHSTLVVATNLDSHIGGAFNGPAAQYVSQDASCPDCHAGGRVGANAQTLGQYAASGHADLASPAWITNSEHDWPVEPSCKRCHTTVGFLESLTGSSTVVSAGEPGQVLSCKACHAADFTVRSVAPYPSPYPLMSDTETAPYAPHPYSDFLTSNLCVPCHAGTISGESIKQAFSAANPPTAPMLNHDLVAAGVLDNTIGYEYDEVPGGIPDAYQKSGTWHAGIGKPSLLVDTGTQGPCVTCHMSAPGQEHTFGTVTKDGAGIITTVLGQTTLCDKCHPSQDPSSGGGLQMTATVLQSTRDDFSRALAALKAQLQAKNLDPELPPPANWGATALIGANNMGAYYNYFLLSTQDKGSYVHNPTYVKRLILYSIDWLDDNTLNGSVYTAISTLPLDATVAEGAIRYLGVVGGPPDDMYEGGWDSCCNCHANICF